MSQMSGLLLNEETPQYETRLSNMMRSLAHVMPSLSQDHSQNRIELVYESLLLPADSKSFIVEEDFTKALLPYVELLLATAQQSSLSHRTAMRDLVPPILALLRVLTEHNPVVPQHVGDMRSTVNDWLVWGVGQRLLENRLPPPSVDDAWKAKFTELSERSDKTKALQHLYSRVDDLSDNENFVELDSFVSSFDPESLSTELLVGLLRITYPFKQKLPSWNRLLTSAHDILAQRGLPSKSVLAGL